MELHTPLKPTLFHTVSDLAILYQNEPKYTRVSYNSLLLELSAIGAPASLLCATIALPPRLP
eukprot:c38893_g1_i1 orf=1-183(-)